MVAKRDLLWVKPYKLDQMETDKKITSRSENHNLQIAMRHVSNLALKIISQKPKKFLCNQNVIL